MKDLVFKLSLLVSVVLYYNAPLLFDRDFCIVCLIVYAINAILIIRNDIKNIGIFNFNLLFLFSFFVCSYVYPVFLIGRPSIIGMFIEYDLNTHDTVNRCVALCTIAACCYAVSYVSTVRDTHIMVTSDEIIDARVITQRINFPMVLICVLMLMVLINFVRTKHEVNIEVEDAPYLFELFYLMLPLYLVCNTIYNKQKNGIGKRAFVRIFKENKLVVLLLLLLLVMFLYIGDRFPLMTITFMVLATITYFIKKIKPIRLISFSLIGILLMFALRVTRGGETSLSEGGFNIFIEATQTSIKDNASVWDLLSDLVGINMELNAGMDYCDKKGSLDPIANGLVAITAPVPFLPTMITSNLYGKMPRDIVASAVIKNYTTPTAGNHCVIDIYMPFGVIGVIIVFCLFGLGVAKLTNGLNNNLYCKVFYIYLISISIFIARNSLINVYRAFILLFIIYCILTRFNRHFVDIRQS